MKTIVVTPAFCKAELLDYSLGNYYENQTQSFEHYILLNHYPINKEENNRKIYDIAYKYNCKIFDNEFDRGLHEGLNNFLNKSNFPENTIMIGFDPDSAIEPMSIGFDKAMDETLRIGKVDHGIAILALWGIGIDLKYRMNKGVFDKTLIGNKCVFLHPSVEMWSVAAFDLDFIKQVGGFKQPHAYYGGAEIALCGDLVNNKRCLAYLTEYKERYHAYPKEEVIDQIYAEWKRDHLAGFTGSLEEYINR